jgi:DNA-binding CsgD family transcriptional regulator
LKLVDLASDDAGNEPSQRKLLNMKTGKLYLFNDIENNPSENLLSKREIEVLGLISQGLKSKNIADRLYISVNTVNNHRQNILSKTKSVNTSHALFYAKQIGII